MIELHDVVKLYDGGVVRALDGVTMTAAAGEFVAVTGPSGCGKSTLLHLVGALDHPTSGKITVNGRDLRSAGNEHYRRREVGFVFQFHNLLPNLTSIENIEIPMFSNGMSHGEQRARAHELLTAVGLAGKERATPPKLSGGERQRLAIARALANRPPLVLADEPTGSLDSAAVDRVLELFQRLRDEQSLTLLLVTHDAHVAAAAGRVVHMRDGRIVDAPDGEVRETAR